MGYVNSFIVPTFNPVLITNFSLAESFFVPDFITNACDENFVSNKCYQKVTSLVVFVLLMQTDFCLALLENQVLLDNGRFICRNLL